MTTGIQAFTHRAVDVIYDIYNLFVSIFRATLAIALNGDPYILSRGF